MKNGICLFFFFFTHKEGVKGKVCKFSIKILPRIQARFAETAKELTFFFWFNYSKVHCKVLAEFVTVK